jgi:hypothetical protein
MASTKKRVLVVNVLYWIVAGLVHPVTSLMTSSSGDTPKFFSLLIPLFYVGLAFGSTWMVARALSERESLEGLPKNT